MLQIVTELDGFDPRGNIKVLMATNRPDTLDPALVCSLLFFELKILFFSLLVNIVFLICVQD